MNCLPHDIVINQASQQDWPDISLIESVIKTRTEKEFAKKILDSNRVVFIARMGGEPVGYVVLNLAPLYSLFKRLEIPELQDLNVIPEARHRGVGAALVRVCEDEARKLGAAQIGLAVGLHKFYGPAQRLYVRLGYMPDGFGVTYDRETIAPGEMRPVDDDLCLMMVKTLASL